MKFIESFPKFHKWYRESFVYKIIHPIILIIPCIRYKYMAIIEFITSIPRALGYNDRKYSKIKNLRNKYKSKRCFIACTGPSLTISDLEMLKDEYVFGMNSIALIHDKTDWVPDFYGIQDLRVFEKIKESVLSTHNGIIFAPYGLKKNFNTPDNWVYWHMCGSYHLFEMTYIGKYFTKFSNECYVRIYDGYSIAYSLLQIAMYMGFDEIYLLGADCSYLGKQQHFIETGHYDPSFKEMTQKLLSSYSTAKKYAELHGIKIFNATRGGCLELFPRVQLEEIILKSQKNKVR